LVYVRQHENVHCLRLSGLLLNYTMTQSYSCLIVSFGVTVFSAMISLLGVMFRAVCNDQGIPDKIPPFWQPVFLELQPVYIFNPLL